MYKTIINNNDTIINSVIIKYSIYYNKHELLQLIPNPEEKDILLILSTMKKLKYYILPSTIYLNYFKYADAYECFMHIKYLYNEDYDNIVKFLLGDNYQLTNEEFVIWIKNFNCLIPEDSGFSFDIIKLHEYVKKNCSNDIYEEFMQSYLKNNYVMKFIFVQI